MFDNDAKCARHVITLALSDVDLIGAASNHDV